MNHESCIVLSAAAQIIKSSADCVPRMVLDWRLIPVAPSSGALGSVDLVGRHRGPSKYLVIPRPLDAGPQTLRRA